MAKRVERLFARVDGKTTCLYDNEGMLRGVIRREVDGVCSYLIDREAGRVRSMVLALNAVREAGFSIV